METTIVFWGPQKYPYGVVQGFFHQHFNGHPQDWHVRVGFVQMGPCWPCCGSVSKGKVSDFALGTCNVGRKTQVTSYNRVTYIP